MSSTLEVITVDEIAADAVMAEVAKFVQLNPTDEYRLLVNEHGTLQIYNETWCQIEFLIVPM